MKHYKGQQEFALNKSQDYRSLIPDVGVSVKVEFYNGSEWVEDDYSPVTDPSDVSCFGEIVRLTPSPISGGFGFGSEG